MTITITMDLTEENLNKLKTLLPDAAPVFDAPKKKAVEPETAKATETPAVQPTPQTETAPAEAPAAKVSKTDVKAVALKLSRANKQKELAAVFAKFGAKKLSDIPEDKYGELLPLLIEEAGKLVADNG